MLEHLWESLMSFIKGAFLWLLGLLLVGVGVWQYPTLKQQLQPMQENARDNALELGISAKQVALLIDKAEPGVPDTFGWANDLRSALETHSLPRSRENVCAMIAVVDQESSFRANPAIPGLGEKSVQAIVRKLEGIPLVGSVANSSAQTLLERYPTPEDNYLAQIRRAKTERDLDLLYRDIMATLLQSKGGTVLRDSQIVRDLTEGMNEIDTIGSMQVAVSFAVRVEEERLKRTLTLEEVWGIRNRMYTRKGGMEYGALLLLGYASGYAQKIHRFADFNAGRYASRNAAFQAVVTELLGRKLATDGDLLSYGADGNPTAVVSNSEQAINDAVAKYRLGLSAAKVRTDLLQEKVFSFNDTATYRAIVGQYRKLKGKDAPYAIIPGIVLQSEKASRILTTEKFATTVDGRYQRCMAESL
ncbi:MAG: hypothetical protein BWK73_30090 [Thiothrix lacustris]|uniref:Uncharacterized protein n=1 Tax=Thiothrix lacustris TaxID=525917 RepID=A0A1Y1QIT1_9GAMM|nr:MAG: hypothetical protein BWK73_30090 [Thiothrix lacustris]